MEKIKNYSDLYKNHKLKAELQSRRRQQLLEEQKKNRAKAQDESRNISFHESRKHKSNGKRRRTYAEKYGLNHKIQLSEWLTEKPDDIDRWFVVPCPKGQRCFVIATDGRTEMYDKKGKFIRAFKSSLPGGRDKRDQVTILDCFFAKDQETYYVVDLLACSNQEMINCEAEFRFFWIKSKLSEAGCEKTGHFNNYAFVPLKYYNFEDELSISDCFMSFPHWEDNSPELDGFLFYHKESSYVYGTTPLVLWLFSFMVPELLGIPVNSKYMESKPEDYVDYLHYITIFDENLAKQRHNKNQRRNTKMDDSIDSQQSEDMVAVEKECDVEEGEASITNVECESLDDFEIIDIESEFNCP